MRTTRAKHSLASCAALATLALLVACSSEPATESEPAGATSPVVLDRPPIREALEGGPFPALLITQAQFVDRVDADGKTMPVPGPAKLVIARQTDSGWKTTTLEDPDSNVFHKAMLFEDGILTIGAQKAALKVWSYSPSGWTEVTHWQPTFGGRFDRLRDIERGDVDWDGKDELVVATHDQGVVAVIHPDEGWRVEIADQQPDTFVHEIEIGDPNGEGKVQFFATPSHPNKLGAEQGGEVRMYRPKEAGGWEFAVVEKREDTHAKEILVTDIEGNGKDELFVVWEGAVAEDGSLEHEVTIQEHKILGGKIFANRTVAIVPDRQMRVLAAGDVNGDGRIDLDGDGTPEIYVGAEDQGELRRHAWKDGKFETTTIVPLHQGDISWNITDGKL